MHVGIGNYKLNQRCFPKGDGTVGGVRNCPEQEYGRPTESLDGLFVGKSSEECVNEGLFGGYDKEVFNCDYEEDKAVGRGAGEVARENV